MNWDNSWSKSLNTFESASKNHDEKKIDGNFLILKKFWNRLWLKIVQNTLSIKIKIIHQLKKLI